MTTIVFWHVRISCTALWGDVSLAIVEFCVEHKSSTKALISFSKHAFVLFSQPRFRLHSFFFKDKPAKKNKGRGAFKILSDKKYYI